ncbi:Protein Y53G8AR.8, partial [Aphelenchoides avenae]
LRHLLVGSPSGYSWSEQVEKILSFEHQWNLRKQIPTDPKMLPQGKREERLQELGVGEDTFEPKRAIASEPEKARIAAKASE